MAYRSAAGGRYDSEASVRAHEGGGIARARARQTTLMREFQKRGGINLVVPNRNLRTNRAFVEIVNTSSLFWRHTASKHIRLLQRDLRRKLILLLSKGIQRQPKTTVEQPIFSRCLQPPQDQCSSYEDSLLFTGVACYRLPRTDYEDLCLGAKSVSYKV